MNPKPLLALYVDGGVILKNPSPFGGTWAFVLVDIEDQRIVKERSGLMLPESWNLTEITNNQSEMYAMLKGLEALPVNVPAIICPDSQVTLGRCFLGHRWNNIPAEMHTIYQTERLRLESSWANLTPVLHAGHPTAADLAAGFKENKKYGAKLPVSKWNARCDRACTHQAEAYMEFLNKAKS